MEVPTARPPAEKGHGGKPTPENAENGGRSRANRGMDKKQRKRADTSSLFRNMESPHPGDTDLYHLCHACRDLSGVIPL